MRNLWLWVGLAILVMVGSVLAWREWGGAPGGAQVAEDAAARNLPMEVTAEDKILGSADAPVTVIEYASLTCPHCASFHKGTLPKLKSDWIDTGTVRLVYRDFPLDGAALAAATLAHCIPGDRYFGLIELLFERQSEWAIADEWRERLTTLAAVAGIDKATVDQCLADDARKNAVVRTREDAEAKYAISSTPSFIINGRKISGAQPIERFLEVIEDAQPKS